MNSGTVCDGMSNSFGEFRFLLASCMSFIIFARDIPKYELGYEIDGLKDWWSRLTLKARAVYGGS